MKFNDLPTKSRSGRTLDLENGLIQSVSISNKDHGCLTAYLHITFNCGGCGFGGYKLGNADGSNLLPSSKNYAGDWIVRCLNTVGVTKWEDLVGEPVRCLHEGFGGGIVAIGHLFKDQWFCPRVEWKDQP